MNNLTELFTYVLEYNSTKYYSVFPQCNSQQPLDMVIRTSFRAKRKSMLEFIVCYTNAHPFNNKISLHSAY